MWDGRNRFQSEASVVYGLYTGADVYHSGMLVSPYVPDKLLCHSERLFGHLSLNPADVLLCKFNSDRLNGSPGGTAHFHNVTCNWSVVDRAELASLARLTPCFCL